MHSMFAFQKLDVFQCSVRFLSFATQLARGLPRGEGEVLSQLKRAALSIPLNIAEGTGKFGRESARFYLIARGSTFECAALLDVLCALELANDDGLATGRDDLERIASMLTRMIQRLQT